MKRLLSIALLALVGAAVAAPEAGTKGLELAGAPSVALSGSPYRYVAVSPAFPGFPGQLTVVEQISRDGGQLGRWWYLRGSYHLPAVAYDGSAGGLSANENTLVLRRFTPNAGLSAPRISRFAILDTDVYLRHPRRPGQERPRHAVTRVALRGDFRFDAISPNGSKIYLIHYLTRSRSSAYEVRALDTASGRLLPEPIVDPAEPQERIQGLPITRAASPDGRWAYTLYDGNDREPFLHALDTVGEPNQLLSVDTRTFTVQGPDPVATAARRDGFLAFTQAPRYPGDLLLRAGVAGDSVAGRPIGLRQLGDPTLDGEVLVFGCIHGDECAGSEIEPVGNGCPDPGADLYVVPNLDPDGAARGNRLNGRGVDLNRNFPSHWRPIGSRGDPQYAGPHPFSEPETRLAARIVRRLQPRVTIWFHQHAGPALVRAWGQSAPAARRFARLARLPFYLLPWPAGTAPNWQNHRFPGTSSFVVELSSGRLASGLESRLGSAIVQLGRKVGED